MTTDAGAPDVDAQPPCFLRYSPAMFAAEAPAMFEHDEETNTLRLRDPEGGYPWMSERAGEWLYTLWVGRVGRVNLSGFAFILIML